MELASEMSDTLKTLVIICGVKVLYVVAVLGSTIISPILILILPIMSFLALIMGDTLLTPSVKRIGSNYLMLPYHLWWGYVYLVASILQYLYSKLFDVEVVSDTAEWKMIMTFWVSIPLITLVAIFTPMVTLIIAGVLIFNRRQILNIFSTKIMRHRKTTSF